MDSNESSIKTKKIKRYQQEQFLTTNLFQEPFDSSIDASGVGTLDKVNLLATLAEEEGWHSGDTVVASGFGNLVNVDLVESDSGVCVAQLLDGRADGLAGTAPGGEEVDDDGTGSLVDLGLVILLTRNAMLGNAMRRDEGQR